MDDEDNVSPDDGNVANNNNSVAANGNHNVVFVGMIDLGSEDDEDGYEEDDDSSEWSTVDDESDDEDDDRSLDPGELVEFVIDMAMEDAVTHDDVQHFQRLLEANPQHDVLKERKGLNTLLHCANSTTSADCLRFLLQQDESRVNARGSSGLTPLLFAVESGSLVCVQELLKYDHLDIDMYSEVNKSAIFLAAKRIFEGSKYNPWHGHEQKVEPREEVFLKIGRLLIEHGANVNVRDGSGHLLLHWACKSRAVLAKDLVELLLPLTKYKAETECKLKMSPMQLAIGSGDYAKVKMMLKFVNRSEFVVPNRETVNLSPNSFISTYVTNVGMLFNHPHLGDIPLQLELIKDMLDLGWKLNNPGLSSAMSVYCDSHFINTFISHNSSGRFHKVPEAIVTIFSQNGAFMKPYEAIQVMNELLYKHECYPLVLKAYTEAGLIPPEILLKIDWDEAMPETLQEAKIVVLSAMSLIFVLNKAFGNQGIYHKKILEALNIKTQYDTVSQQNKSVQWLREKNVVELFKKEAFDSIKSEISIGSLQLQSRAVIRQRLMDRGHFHPWQMREALKACPSMRHLVKFIVDTKLEGWPVIDPLDIRDMEVD